MILAQYVRKIKSSLASLDKREYWLVALIILTATASYLIGRMSVLTDNSYPTRIISSNPSISPQTSGTANASLKNDAMVGVYVGSKNGTKYHLPECPGAKRITDSNKIWFKTREDAESAGYTPASNCPGL